MKNENWVDEVLAGASKTVQEWPEWMRRPEVRAPESLLSGPDREHQTSAPVQSEKKVACDLTVSTTSEG